MATTQNQENIKEGKEVGWSVYFLQKLSVFSSHTSDQLRIKQVNLGYKPPYFKNWPFRWQWTCWGAPCSLQAVSHVRKRSIGTRCRETADKGAQASCLGMRPVDCDP